MRWETLKVGSKLRAILQPVHGDAWQSGNECRVRGYFRLRGAVSACWLPSRPGARSAWQDEKSPKVFKSKGKVGVAARLALGARQRQHAKCGLWRQERRSRRSTWKGATLGEREIGGPHLTVDVVGVRPNLRTLCWHY